MIGNNRLVITWSLLNATLANTSFVPHIATVISLT